MDTARLLSTVRAILAQPTAPFHEDAVRGEILMQLAQCPHVTVEQDDFGNVIAFYRRGLELPRYAFAAHMDHPAYVGEKFLGGVPEDYLKAKPTVRDFGAFAMWDLPACDVSGDRIHSRACDDLIGCAVIVALFHELEQRGAECACYGIFTRAEEVGFIGAIHLARAGRLPRDVTIVSLETSSENAPGAGKMGAGVIVRVGDKTSIFDSDETATLTRLAADGKIPAQRCLMSGGTCEATAYQLYGYRSAALCIALGNYHNCGPENQITSEYVAITDVEALARLCVAAAEAGVPPDPRAQLRNRLEQRVEEYRKYF